MSQKDDSRYDLERGFNFLRATACHVSPLQICYHNTPLKNINSNTISQATFDTRVVTVNTSTDAVNYRY